MYYLMFNYLEKRKTHGENIQHIKSTLNLQLYLLAYHAVYPIESQQTFRRKKSLLPSGLKSKPRSACCLLHVSFLLGLFFNPEDGGDMFLRNVG
jgi:hypothetical protein